MKISFQNIRIFLVILSLAWFHVFSVARGNVIQNNLDPQLEVITPSSCSSMDGAIIITELDSNTAYEVQYHNGSLQSLTLTTNTNGTLTINNLPSGDYQNLMLTNLVLGDQISFGTVEVPHVPLPAVISSVVNASECFANGNIKISGLEPFTDYDVTYIFGGLQDVTLTSDFSGLITVSGLAPGFYINLTVEDINNGCYREFDPIEIEGDLFDAVFSIIPPSGCDSQDAVMSFAVSNTSPAVYEITYSVNNQSFSEVVSGNGINNISVYGLDAGFYYDIFITDIDTGCFDNMGYYDVPRPEINLARYFAEPSGCLATNGVITITGFDLDPLTSFEIAYTHNGMPQNLIIESTDTGQLIMTGLGTGLYDNFSISEIGNDDCHGTIEPVELIAPEMETVLNINGTTACNTTDGALMFSELNSEMEYALSYVNGNGETGEFIQMSNSQGQLEFTSLSAGLYASFTLVEVETSCFAQFEDVLISAPELEIELDVAPASRCGESDAALYLYGLQPNASYEVGYSHGGSPFSLDLESNSNGILTIMGLDAGTYGSLEVLELSSGCSKTLGSFEIESQDLVLDFEPIIPSNCAATDGEIIINDLLPNEQYQIYFSGGIQDDGEYQVYSSDSDGTLTLLGLSAGIYDGLSLVEVSSGCVGVIETVRLGCLDGFGCYKLRSFFTPNQDGENDFWGPEAESQSCDYTLRIFNRFGKQLAVLSPRDYRWDGTYEGQQMPSDDYWFTVEYVDDQGNPGFYRSHFTLKR